MLRDFDDHRLHRRILQAAFKPKALADYTARMNDGVASALGRWRPGRMRFYDAVKQLTLELGATIFMGADPGAEARRVNRAFVAELAAAVAVVRTPLPGNRTWRGLRARAFLLDWLRRRIPNAAPAKETTCSRSSAAPASRTAKTRAGASPTTRSSNTSTSC